MNENEKKSAATMALVMLDIHFEMSLKLLKDKELEELENLMKDYKEELTRLKVVVSFVKEFDEDVIKKSKSSLSIHSYNYQKIENVLKQPKMNKN